MQLQLGIEPSTMKRQSAKFLVNVRENCKISQNAVESVTEGVVELVQSYLQIGFVRF